MFVFSKMRVSNLHVEYIILNEFFFKRDIMKLEKQGKTYTADHISLN